MPVEVTLKDLLRLGIISEDDLQESPKKITRKLMRRGYVQSFHTRDQLFILEQVSGRDCIFLDPRSRTCTVYEKRPDVCRNFPKVGPRSGYCPRSS